MSAKSKLNTKLKKGIKLKNNIDNPLKQYTIEDIDSMLDEAEKDFEIGYYLTNDEVFHTKHQ